VDTDLLDADTRNHAVGMLSDVFRDRPKQPKRAEIINAAIPLRQELLDAGDADAHLLLAVGDKDLDASDVKRFYTQIVDRLDEVPERNRATAINRTLRSLCSAVTQNRDGALDAAKSVLEHPWLARAEKHHWGYLTKCVQIVELVGAWDVERVVALPVGKLDQLVALLPKQIVRGTAMATPAKGLFRNPNLTVDVAVKVASRTDGGVWVVRELAAAGHVEALLRLVEHSVKALTYAQHVARVTDTASATLRRADAATLRRAAAARLQWAAVREQLFETDGGANSQSNRRVHLRQLASLGWLRMMPWSTLQNNEFMNAELVTAVFHELTEHLDHLDGLDTFDTLAASFDGTFGELIDAVNALTDLEGAGPPATEAA